MSSENADLATNNSENKKLEILIIDQYKHWIEETQSVEKFIRW